jgi:hypothetical protein
MLQKSIIYSAAKNDQTPTALSKKKKEIQISSVSVVSKKPSSHVSPWLAALKAAASDAGVIAPTTALRRVAAIN